MRPFTLRLQDAARSEQFDTATLFVGEDASGSFGIMAGHTRFMTSLVFGMARFQTADQRWHYLALPGALLYFNGNQLTLSSRRYLVGDDYEQMSDALQHQLVTEEAKLHRMKKGLSRMEEEMFRRLWKMGRAGG